MKKATKVTLTILIAVLTIPAILWTLAMGAGLVLQRFDNGGVFGKTGDYPLSILAERNIPHLDLREIEGLPQALDDNQLGINPQTKLPYDNNVKIKRSMGTTGVLWIQQRINNEEYSSRLTIEVAVGSSPERFQKYIDEEAEFWQGETQNDPRFDLLKLYEYKGGCSIFATRGLMSVRLSYDGKLKSEFFIQKADELLS